MNSKILAACALSLLTAISIAAAGCGSSNASAAKNGRFDPVPGFGGQSDDDDDVGDDDDDGSTPGDDDDDDDGGTIPDATPTPNEEPCTPTAEDQDCDGIPDDVDNIDCQAYTLRITNTDVSSAEILLNAVEVAGTNDFPTTDILEVKINPVTGLNTLTVAGKLAGSPGDILHFQTVDGDAVVIFEQTVTRSNGQPAPVDLQFVIDEDCSTTP